MKSLPLSVTQNFLHNKKLVEELVSRANISPGDVVLEIGPGKGIITKVLTDKVGENGKVLAVELDEALFSQLTEKFKTNPQVKLFHQDILHFSPQTLPKNYKVFSNIPFTITAKLFEHLFDSQHGPQDAYLILQEDCLLEVRPNKKPQTTLKSFLIEPLYDIKLQHRFSASDFYPQPQVNTALFHFQKKLEPLLHADEYQHYKDFLAYISRDRVGEGVWKNLATGKELRQLQQQLKLQLGKGLKSQTTQALIQLLRLLILQSSLNVRKISGAMKRLRQEQQRREEYNRANNFHQSNKHKRKT